MRYEVYRNLHNGLFSIREKKSKLVVAHARKVGLCNVKFVVKEAGNKRARDTGVRNVHAWVEGELGIFEGVSYKGRDLELHSAASNMEKMTDWNYENFTYNPFKFKTFVDKDKRAVYDCIAAKLEIKDGEVICEMFQ